MNKQRKVLITTTYNEMGVIVDAKAEEVAQPNLQPTCNQLTTDTISRQAAIDALDCINGVEEVLRSLPPAQPEEYTELKREFLRMASYIDVLLECSDAQKETLNGFISRLAEFMPWTERV